MTTFDSATGRSTGIVVWLSSDCRNRRCNTRRVAFLASVSSRTSGWKQFRPYDTPQVIAGQARGKLLPASPSFAVFLGILPARGWPRSSFPARLPQSCTAPMTVLTKVCSHFAPFRPHSFTKARTQGTPHRCSMTFRVGQPFQADVRLESLTYVADLTTKSDPASGVPPGSKGGSKSGKDHPFLAAGKRGWPFPPRICPPPYAIRHLPSAIRHLPSAIRHPALDEAASPRDGGSGLGGCAGWKGSDRRTSRV